jgi:outer membrane immunogenic protein
MKKHVVSVAVLSGYLAIANVAMAADPIAPDPGFDWSGPYVGVQGGYGWQSNNDIDEITTATGVLINQIPRDDKGYFGGLHAGYNFANGSFVYGIESDLEYSGIESDGFDGLGNHLDKSIDWLGSLRARAGVTVDRALLYVTGGLAAGLVDMEAREDGVTSISESELAFGWTAGAGVEFAITDSLSANVEYRYTDLADTENTGTIFNGGFTYEHENRFQAVRAGLSWHF